jgi:hypothetical protein
MERRIEVKEKRGSRGRKLLMTLRNGEGIGN